MLVDSNRIPEVALMARSYLPSKVYEVAIMIHLEASTQEAKSLNSKIEELEKQLSQARLQRLGEQLGLYAIVVANEYDIDIDQDVGALENFIKQSQIKIIELQHIVDEHSLSNLEIVYDFGAKMVEALEKDKVQSGDAIAIDKVFEYFALVENTIGETLMTPGINCYSVILIISNLNWWKAIYHDAVQGAQGDVFARGTNLGNAHGMAAMVIVFIYQSALLIGLYIRLTASKWNLWSSVPKLALKESTPKGHTEDTIMVYFTCSVVVFSVNDDNEIADTTPLEFLAYELVMVIFI
ncbi:hypothetical protein Tco_1183268 [Tanacetum coccineum]